jgi:hypothetical protein
LRGGLWRRRLPVIICAILVLSAGAGLPSAAQQESTAATPEPFVTPEPSPPRTPFSQGLIEAALAAGTIDYPTSLLYRAYALFGDPRLPAELTGAGSSGEDSGLAHEVELAGADLPAAIRDALIPFLVRPSDPRSYFNQPPANAKRVPSLQDTNAQPANPACQNGWLGRRSAVAGVAFKVWAACDGTAETDIAFLLAFAESLWSPMTSLMGPPRPDAGGATAGGDDAIDVYLVGAGQAARDRQIPSAAFAAAWPDEPKVGTKSSGYILAPRVSLRTDFFRYAFAHEFFHVLQFAHNSAFMFRWNGDFDNKGTRIWDEFWFVEASATWAGIHFVRPLSPRLHAQYFSPYQRDYPDVSLHASKPQSHTYTAYIWAFFMEQEVSDQAISAVWKALETVPPNDWNAANRAIDAQLRFSTRFRDFAVRNFNKPLPGNPIDPLYQALDPGVPNTMPNFTLVSFYNRQLGQPPHQMEHTIRSLTANYDVYAPEPDTEQVTFWFDGLQPGEALDVDAIYKIKGEPNWVRRKLNPGEKLRFCFNNPEEDLEDLVLVLSNHALQIDTTVAGEYSVMPLGEPCGEYRLEGTYRVYWGDRSGPLIDSWQFEGEFSLDTVDENGQPLDPNQPNGWGTFRGSQGQFDPQQEGCEPARSVPWRGQLAISAAAEGDLLTVMVMPVQPPNGELIPDVFNTRFDFTQAGGKTMEVPVDGGTYRWGGGIWALEVECNGLKPASGGTFTIVKIRDDSEPS